jgi:hypothetical protein
MTPLYKLWQEGISKRAVWKAAVGENADLLSLLRSNRQLSPSVRQELALLIEGKLVPAKKKRGRPVAEAIPDIAIARHMLSKLGMAVNDFKVQAQEMRESGKLYGKTRDLIEAVAASHNVDPNALENAVRNGHPLPKLPDIASDDAAEFRRWLDGRDLRF